MKTHNFENSRIRFEESCAERWKRSIHSWSMVRSTLADSGLLGLLNFLAFRSLGSFFASLGRPSLLIQALLS